MLSAAGLVAAEKASSCLLEIWKLSRLSRILHSTQRIFQPLSAVLTLKKCESVNCVPSILLGLCLDVLASRNSSNARKGLKILSIIKTKRQK